MSTTPSTTHSAVVDRQFGSQAALYVASAVHASGADLDWMEARLREWKPAALLDLGCGGGHVAYRAAGHSGTVTAADLSPAMLEAVAAEAKRRGIANVATARTRAERLPFADASFDVVATRFSAHHWSDVAAGLREARRVLKKGGRLLVMDAVSPGTPLLDTHLQAVEALRDPSHVRDYSATEWLGFLGGAGFDVTATKTHRLRMEFANWTERMRTPDVAKAAIRYLQNALPAEAGEAVGLEPDGSFMLDTLWMEAVRRA